MKIKPIVLIYYTNKRKQMFCDLTIFIYETQSIRSPFTYKIKTGTKSSP